MFEYQLPGYDSAAAAKGRYEYDLANVDQAVAVANRDLEATLATLPAKIASAVVGRKENIRSKNSASAVFGIPVESSVEPSKVVGGTIEQYREMIVKPKHRDAAEPVPAVEFDGILGVIDYAGRQWELYPANTQNWGEDEFRNSILSFLNLPYKGQATGETFIRNGKSDILLRDNGIELFIAECKIWSGQAQVHSELDQLFTRYQTWRATKAALIYFNRGKNTTAAMDHLRAVLPKHPAHVTAAAERGPTHFDTAFGIQPTHSASSIWLFSSSP